MSNCYYIYSTKVSVGKPTDTTISKERFKELIADKSIEEIQQLEGVYVGKTTTEIEMALINKGIYNENAILLLNPSLIFYDATKSPKEEVEIKLKAILQKGEPKSYDKRVTEIISDLFIHKNINTHSNTPDFERGESTESIWIDKFLMNLGTYFHNCVETFGTKKFDKKCDELISFLEECKETIKTINTSHPAVENRASIVLKGDMTLIRESLKKICDTIHRSAGFNKETIFELPLLYEAPSGEKISGHLDAVQVLNDGSVVIYDFKTSSRPRTSDTATISHFAQLFMYQLMLSKYGIDADKISIVNINLAYNENGFSFKSEGESGSPFYTFRRDLNTNKLESSIKTRLRHYFPLIHGGVLEAEAREILKDIKTIQTDIFSEKSLNKNEDENLTKYLEDIAGTNKPFRSVHLSEEFIVKSANNNTLVLTPLEGGKNDTYNLSEFVKQEITAREYKRSEEFNGFKQAIKSKDVELVKKLLSAYKGRDLNLVNSLRHYLEPLWEVVDFGDEDNNNSSSSTLFESLGILVMYNNATDTYDFINFTSNIKLETPYTLHYDEKRTMNLLGNLFSDDVLAKYKSANMMANVSNIKVLQTLIAISLGQKTLKTKNGIIKVGTIKTVSDITGHESFNINYLSFVRQLAIIYSIAKDSPEKVKHKDLYTKVYEGVKTIQWAPFEDTLIDKLNGLIFNYDEITTQWANDFKSALNADTLSDKITKLIAVQESFRSDFYQEFDNTNKLDRTYITDIQKIDQLLSTLINTYQGLMTDQAFMTSGMGLSYDDSIRAAWQLIRHGDVGKFSADGMLITGLLLGLSSATPYANPDDTVRMLSTLHTFGTTQIQMEANPYIDDQNRATSEWLESKKGLFEILIVGNHRELYKQLFQTENGKLDPKFRFKNPFTDSSLTEADKKYLFHTIWNLLRIREEFTLFDTDVKRLTWDEFAKSESNKKLLKNYIAGNPESLNVPLRTGSEGRLVLEMCKSVAQGDWKTAGSFWKRKIEKSKQWFDPSGLTDKQTKDKEDKIKALKAYNMYSESLTDRTKRLSQNPLDAFEWNVNFLVNDFIYSNISVNVNQKILDTTDRMVASLKYIEMLTGRNLSDQIQTIKERTRISIFNSNNVEDSYKDAVDFVSHLRKALNIGKIAFRPLLMAKELTVSRIKNYAYTMFDYFQNDGISLKSMAKADAIVFTEGIITDKFDKITGKMKPGDKSKVEALNWLYRIANMDANIVSQKTVADRNGFMNMGGDIAYYTNTRPDWYSRMLIFVAKMIEDGTWDAHELDELNRITYKMEKDSRYSIFIKYLNKIPPKPSDSDFKEYQKQKARYNWALASMTKAGIKNKNGLQLQYGDMLPIAYTVEEVNSIKELTGMLYGYYNHEEKTGFLTATYSNLFMAFKTYLAGELKHYFALPDSKTSMGKVTHIVDSVTGNPLYVQYDPVLDIETYTEDQYDKNGNPNQPHYGWVASPQEGLMTSLLICIGDVFTEKGRQDLRTNKRRRLNAELFLFRAILFGLFASLFAILLKGADDETAKGLKVAYDVARKASNDLSFYHSVIAPIDDMGIVGVEYVTSLARGAMDTLTNGDKSIQTYIFNNLQSAKDIVSIVE